MIKIKDNATIVFAGDSITHGFSSIEEYKPYGKGFVDFVANILLAQNYKSNLKIYNAGIGGNTTSELLERWQKDVLDLEPDIVVLLIGVNDVLRKYEEDRSDESVSVDQCQSNIKFMLDTLVKNNVQVVLMQPFMFVKDNYDQRFSDILRYGDRIKELAENYSDITFIPMQEIITKEFEDIDMADVSYDSIHPHRWAHCWLGLELLKYFTK
ncbi:MAG: SGNH/GDSL hydrolase family protein [Sedimentisphaeraceae bacterium JB056]